MSILAKYAPMKDAYSTRWRRPGPIRSRVKFDAVLSPTEGMLDGRAPSFWAPTTISA